MCMFVMISTILSQLSNDKQIKVYIQSAKSIQVYSAVQQVYWTAQVYKYTQQYNKYTEQHKYTEQQHKYTEYTSILSSK